MAVKVYDRDKWQADRKARNRAASEEYLRTNAANMRTLHARFRRDTKRINFWDGLRLAWRSIWHMGMYSSDPQLARMAMVHTAQEQIGVQRQITAQQRAEDQLREEERARALARAMVQEMREEIRRGNK